MIGSENVSCKAQREADDWLFGDHEQMLSQKAMNFG
jgi:hypothetical protein